MVRKLPGILLLFAIGYAGKLIEHAIVPHTEYVLWAIVIGLVVANTVGVPAIFRAGVATYEFWLKTGIVLLGARFVIGDVLKLGAVSLALVVVELAVAIVVHDRAGPRVPSQAQGHVAPGRGLGCLRRQCDHRDAGCH